MGVQRDRENDTWACSCGSCGWLIGPYNSEEGLRKNMQNWSYAFVDDIGNTRCPGCVQAAFDDQQELKNYRDLTNDSIDDESA